MGRRLRRARQRAGLGQAELAEALETDQSTISRIERGAIPRQALLEKATQFTVANERGSDDRISDILDTVAQSEELRALIARVLAET